MANPKNHSHDSEKRLNTISSSLRKLEEELYLKKEKLSNPKSSTITTDHLIQVMGLFPEI